MTSQLAGPETVVRLFEEQVGRSPEALAVVEGSDSLTYAELDRRSNRLARYVRESLGAANGQIVSILMEQSIDFMVCVWGVLKAGHAFLAIEPDLPEQRQSFMLNDAGSQLLLSSKKHVRLLNRLQWECSRLVRFLCVDSDDVRHEPEGAGNPLMDKQLWDLVGHKAVDPIGRGGWRNSFTGELFSEQEIAECRDNVLQKLLPYLRPSARVLEIGCSSGITMFRLAPNVGLYYGTDLSDVILAETQKQTEREGHANIRLRAMPAHEIDTLEERDFDVVIMNSVVQAFDGHNYLRRVIEKAVGLMRPTGVLFLGDVMNQEAKPALAAALDGRRREQAGAPVPSTTDLTHELFLSPEFLSDLVHEQPGLKRCLVSPKIGALRNELTEFRFDALIEVDKSLPPPDPASKARSQDDRGELERHSSERLPLQASEDDLAYVIYTSGSTGRPKGVLVEHKSLANLARWYVDSNSVDSNDRIAKFASSSFDASIMETLPPHTAGAAIYILGSQEKLDLRKLNRFLEAHRVTICFLPTQYAEHFMAMEDAAPSLRLLHTGGEKLRHFDRRPYSVVNHYGPAECTVVSTAFIVEEPSRDIPIGKPLPGTQVHLLDELQNPVPEGAPGEAFISGVNVARGYLNLPLLSAEKFLPDRFRPGARMYRTGDLCRRLADGNLLFVARSDSQVKLRGCRVELEEIESVLREHSAVRAAVVTLSATQAPGPLLAAYVVAAREVSEDELRAHCRARMPEYMLPNAFCLLDALPLNANGKTDRQALPAPETMKRLRGPGAAAGTPIERRLHRIWQEVLGLSDIALTDDFFDLGGNSLKVLQALAETNKAFQTEVVATDLFKARTLPAQAALVAGARSRRFVPVASAEARESYPASSSQKRLYLVQEMDPRSTAYNIPFVFSIAGSLDLGRLEAAFGAVLARYEVLRTGFHLEGGSVVQRVLDEVRLRIEVVEAAGPEVDVEKLVRDFVRPFVPGQAPLMRVKVVRVQPARALLLVDLHHILLDGSSAEVVWRDLAKAYNGGRLGPPRFQFKDFSEWQRGEEVQGLLREQEQYWLAQFRAQVPVLSLPLDFERPAYRSFDGQRHRFTIDEATVGRTRQVCARHDLSPNMLLLAAYTILLARYSGQDDVVTGTPVYGRGHADMKDAVGMFANTLALRTRPRPDQTVAAYLGEVREVLLQALEHQDFPFEELVARLDLPHDVSRNPLFDTMFVTQDFDTESLALEGLEVVALDPGCSSARFDLTWFAKLAGGEIRIEVEYCTALFAEPTVRAMGEQLRNLLEDICADQSREIRALALTSEAERRRLLEDLNPSADFPELSTTIIDGFEKTALEHASSTALVSSEGSWSYAELDARAERIGAFLRSKGCGPGTMVGIASERSGEQIAGMLGILKAGAAIVPLNPAFPAEYLERVLASSGARLVLRHLPGHGELRGPPGEWLDISGIELQPSFRAGERVHASPSDPLYVVHTSGTTGAPKAIAVDNQTLVNLVQHQRRFTDIDFTSVLQYAAPTFDVCFQEVFSCLLSGGKLLLIPEAERTDLFRLFARLEAESIRTVFFPPALLQLIFGEQEYATAFPGCVRHIVAAGEQLAIPARLRELIRSGRVVLHNHYGPSETHVVTTHTIDSGSLASDRPPIGRPIANRPVYILDESGQLQPPGLAGELCVGGRLTRPCYLDDPELSDRRFPPDPFCAGQRMYRTGDLARWNRDGALEFLGRLDSQMKVRGHRIEPAAIETLLAGFPGLAAARVVPVADGSSRQLCAYFVSAAEVSSEELRAHLGEHLPEYMIPSFFVRLGELPLTVNGKLDVASLPSPLAPRRVASAGSESRSATRQRLLRIWQQVLGVRETRLDDDLFELGGHSRKVPVPSPRWMAAVGSEGTARPLSEVETVLLRLWRDVLGVEEIGVDTSFFDAGGHSLKAIGLMLRVRKAFGVDLPNSAIFRYPTVAAMAALLSDGAQGYRFSHLVELSKGHGARRLFCVHPAPGTVICYRELARQLPSEWSVFALQARGLIRGQACHASVEEMAADYVREILRVQPRGPYWLLGWSIGGKIGYEVARQLETLGERVALLAMIDTDPVFLPKPGIQLSTLRLFGFGAWALLSQGRSVQENWHVLDITSYRFLDLWHRLRLWVGLMRAAIRYSPPKHSVTGKVVLLQTAACARREERLGDRTRSIRSVARDLEVRPIGGNHLDLFSSPQIEVVCAELVGFLEKAAGGATASDAPVPSANRTVAEA